MPGHTPSVARGREDEPLPEWALAPAPPWFVEAVGTPSEQRLVEVRGCAVAFREWGARHRPGLLLVHGFAAHSHWWDFLAPSLRDAFDVAAIDLSGMGDSGHRRAYSPELHVEELLAVCDALGWESDVTLAGHSYGGLVSCLAAALQPQRFARLVMVDAALRLPQERAARRRESFGHTEQNVYPTLARALARFRVVPEQSCEHPYLLAHIARHSLKAVVGGFVWKFDDRLFDAAPIGALEPEFAALAGRTCFIYGARSRVVTERHREHMRRVCAGRVPFVPIADADHHLFLNQPQGFTEVLAEVLAGRIAGV